MSYGPMWEDGYAAGQKEAANDIERLRAINYAGDMTLRQAVAEIEQLRAIITRAKDALLDGQTTQSVHDVLVQGLHPPRP